MNDVKPWYKSKGVVGGIVAIIAMVASIFGYTLTEVDQTSLQEVILQVGAAVAAVVALWGRLSAKERVG